MRPAALERRDPELGRVEVDVARSERERLAHAAAGEREGAGERLHGGFGVGAQCDEESRAFVDGEVLPAAGVDQARRRGWGSWVQASGWLAPEHYRSHREVSTTVNSPAI